jgi:hypothetical protein
MSQALPTTPASAPEAPILDLSSDAVDRLFARAPFSPWAVGAAICATLAALHVMATAASGELATFLARDTSLLSDRNARLGMLLPILVAYVPTAQRVLALASRRHLATLERVAGPTSPAALGKRGLTMGICLLFVPLTAFVVDRDTLLYFRADYWSGATVSNWMIGGLFCAGVGRFGHATLSWSRVFSNAAPPAERLDLFDRSWLAPFASQGLLCALLWLVIPTIYAINLGDAPFAMLALPLTLGCVAVGSAAVWLPTSGVRRRLVEAKQAELACAHRAMHGDRAAQEALAVAQHDREPSLTDLLAYERFLQELPTSPFDQRNRVRFVLYLALPLGSWLGGALVERVIGVFLD